MGNSLVLELTARPATATDDQLADWERDALRKLRLLRKAGKPAILFVTDAGAILVFRAEQAGRIGP